MANSELGNKRICPETGKKFYDLNKDPIVSPYTGKSYPLSFFETPAAGKVEVEEEVVEAVEPASEKADVEVVSLEEVEEKDTAKADDPDVDLEDDDDDVDLDDDDDDTFLEDEEDDDDVSGIIDVDDDEEEA